MRMLDEEVAWLLTPNDSLKVNEVFFVKAKLLGRLMVEKKTVVFLKPTRNAILPWDFLGESENGMVRFVGCGRR